MTTLDTRPLDSFDDNDQKPVGYGRMLRKEDPRFVRGMGKYCDDIQLPGMLHLAILRSPLAHARIVSIDVSAAQAHPKVVAVITGADLAEQGLAWMPTLSNDVQAVLATDKVRFQGQEVAFVVAEDRYSARDALELIVVDYDMLPPVMDVRKALAADAPVIRDDLEGKADNHCFDWEAGDEAATNAVFESAERGDGGGHRLPPRAPGADGDLRVRGRPRAGVRQAHPLDHLAGAPRPPHRVRAGVGAARAQDPRDRARHRRRLRQQGADLPGLRVRHRRVAGDRQAGEVDGGPHREPGEHRLRARLRDARRGGRHQGRQDPRHPHQRAGRPRRLQRHRRADQVPGRVLRRVHRQLRPARRPTAR